MLFVHNKLIKKYLILTIGIGNINKLSTTGNFCTYYLRLVLYRYMLHDINVCVSLMVLNFVLESFITLDSRHV